MQPNQSFIVLVWVAHIYNCRYAGDFSCLFFRLFRARPALCRRARRTGRAAFLGRLRNPD